MTRRKRNYACRRKIEPFRTTMIITGETKKMKRLMEQNERKKGKNCSVGFDVLHLLLTAKAFSSLARAVSLSLSLSLSSPSYSSTSTVALGMYATESLLYFGTSFPFSPLFFYIFIHRLLLFLYVCVC